MKNRKRTKHILLCALLIALFASVIHSGVNNFADTALDQTTDVAAQTDNQTTPLADATEGTETTSEATSELTSESIASTEASTETSTEISSEEIMDVTSEASTEMSSEESETSEESTEVVLDETEEDATEESSEETTEDKEMTSEEATTEEAPTKKQIEEEIDNQTLVDGESRTIFNDGNWGDGFRWYIIDSDGNKKYVFCLDHGKTMTSGVYEGMATKWPYQSTFDVFRVATAIAYFDKTGDYGTAQLVIWNMTPDAASQNLMTYINNAWELCDINPNRAASSASFSAGLRPVERRYIVNSDKTVISNAINTLNRDENINKLFVSQEAQQAGYKTRTFSLNGTAWKYFANKSIAGHQCSIKAALIGLDGQTYPYGNATVNANGSVTVTFRPTEGYGDSINKPLAVALSVQYPFVGSSSYTYLKTANGIQNLTYSAPKNGPGSFAFLVYTKETSTTTDEPAEVKINKVDEYGNFVSGATFRLLYRGSANIEPKNILISSPDDSIVIEEPGEYLLKEIATPGSEYRKSTREISFIATEVTEGNVTKLMLTDSNGLYSNQASYTYNYLNEFYSGNALIVKYGNVLVRYEDGRFVYEKRLLSGVNFDFYAAEDIYANETKVFSAGQKITSGTTWGNNRTITLSGTQTNNGNLTINNLPLGKYYALEKRKIDKFSDKQIRFNFTVKADQTVTINGSDGIINEQTPADVYMNKVDADTQTALKGAELTLYAHINNTNYDGQKLFKASQTVPVVTQRNLATGEETVVRGTWVPIKTLTTNASGKATFNHLPIGTYLVAETKAPEGYALSETSYQFTHKYVSGVQETADGYSFTHTMEDQEEHFIRILKNAEYASLENVNGLTPYVYTNAVRPGVKFGVYADGPIVNTSGTTVFNQGDLVGTCVTDDAGYAQLETMLFPGNYYYQELETADDSKYILDETKTTFTVTPESETVITSEAQTNLLYKGSIKVIKTDKETTTLLKDVEFELKDEDGNLIGTYVTDENGEISVTELPVGKYFLQETKTGVEYILDDTVREIDLTATDLDQILEIENEPYKGSIKVIKTDGETTTFLEGVEFELRNKDKEVIGTYVTDEKGEILIEDLRVGTYYLVETKTGGEYILDDKERQIDLTATDLDQILEIENFKYAGQITVIKTDGETKKALEGVEFDLLDSNKKVIGTYTTDSKGKIVIEDLVIGTYYLVETKTGKEYILDDTERQIDLTAEKLEQILEIENFKYAGQIKVIKTDGETKTFLKGVEFNLLDSDKKVIGTYTTDDKGEIIIKDLVVGTYYLQETKTLKSYILDDTMHEVTLTSEQLSEELNITNNKYKGSLKVIKTNGDETVYLEGVEFDLLNEDKEVLGSYVTDKNGEIFVDNLEIGTYYLVETKTLAGYKLDDTKREIEISAENLDLVVTVINEYSGTKLRIRTDDEKDEGGTVNTGDIMIFGVFLLFFAAIIGICILKKRAIQDFIRTFKSRHMMFLLLFGLGVAMASLSVKAAAELKELSSKESENVDYNGTIYEYVLTKTYETSDKDAEYSFQKDVNGFRLADTNYKLVDTVYPTKEISVTKVYEDLASKDESKITQTIEEDGLEYTLSDIAWEEDVKTEEVSYEVELGYFKTEPTEYPATYPYTYTSPVTGEQTTANLPFSHLTNSGLMWHDGFSATVTFENIDGRYFTLGNRSIEYNPNSLSLTNDDFVALVQMLGKDTSLYRFTSAYWNGEEYMENGVKCRDAKLVGQQYGAYYQAVYADTITAATGYTATATYVTEIETDEQPTYVIEASGYYTDQNAFEKMFGSNDSDQSSDASANADGSLNVQSESGSSNGFPIWIVVLAAIIIGAVSGVCIYFKKKK